MDITSQQGNSYGYGGTNDVTIILSDGSVLHGKVEGEKITEIGQVGCGNMLHYRKLTG